MNFTPGRLAAVGAGLLALVGATAVAVNVLVPAPDKPTWRSSIGKLPAAPLAARRDVAAVWTGTEMIVWGGSNQSAGLFRADGAAYDPGLGSWRMLPAAPLGARAEAQAAWTGTEMIVWGGSDARHSPRGVTDGAAYSPGSNRWRRIAAAPGTGRTGGQTLMVDGRMVVFGGSGVDGTDAARTVLVYDPRADRWTTFREPGRVVAAAAAGSTLVLAYTDDDGVVSVEQVSVTGSGLVRGPSPIADDPVDRVGLTVDAGVAYLVLTDRDQRTRIFGGALTDGLVAPGNWTEKETSAEVSAPNQLGTGYPGLATPLRPGVLLLAGMPEVSAVDPRTGRVLLRETTLARAGFCGVSGALVWTGAQILGWGGQTCRATGPALTADGIALTAHPDDRV
ncbi:hypothetical protein GCM10010172_16050 [Paractinoplanes ferrugineus]|uniref:Galactose oxidase n=1 Tax=Paractinoplanes ferrugineus TaxID=113564 RepID=A0A919IXV7_9ACTN|nr:kelch repeat-containing protein [Actinoplanes ferrugineus]GIE10169.1 hypothetical protein Afe05nite_20090 [Actinoplanes ferrugineus]